MVNSKNIKGHEWKPGESGNPEGRPPGKSITSFLKERLEMGSYTVVKGELLNEKMERTGKFVNIRMKITSKDELVAALLSQAKKGNIRAIECILDRIEGRPPLSVDIGTERMTGRFIEPPPGYNEIAAIEASKESEEKN